MRPVTFEEKQLHRWSQTILLALHHHRTIIIALMIEPFSSLLSILPKPQLLQIEPTKVICLLPGLHT